MTQRGFQGDRPGICFDRAAHPVIPLQRKNLRDLRDGTLNPRNAALTFSGTRAFLPHAREETPESRGMTCLFLNTERGFGGKPPQNRGLVGILRGQKCLRRRVSRRSPVGEWSRGAMRRSGSWIESGLVPCTLPDCDYRRQLPSLQRWSACAIKSADRFF